MRLTDWGMVIVALLIAWSLYRAHRDKTAFNLLDLVMDNGRVSKLAVVFLGSFGISSWIMVRITIDGKMTEGLFLAYGATWVAPIVARLFAAPQNVSTSTTTTTEEKHSAIGFVQPPQETSK